VGKITGLRTIAHREEGTMSENKLRGTRRQMLSAMVAAPLVGAAMPAAASKGRAAKIAGPMPEGFRNGPLDLAKPLDNLIALLKLQADLSGKPVYSGFPGKAWGWVPDEGNYLLFNTYGIGATRLEYSPADNAFRFIHREALLYCDPRTGDVLDDWVNPMTGARVEVLHILNDPVNRLYPLAGGPFAPPYPYMVNNDRLIFQLDVLRSTEKSPLTRKDYPLHAQQDLYQSGELWAITGSLREVNDPAVTSAACHTSWKRVSMWLPFMEMGNRPGVMIYHSQSFKFMNGWSELPANIRSWVDKNQPKYLEPPTAWEGLGRNETTWSYSKKVIDARRAEGRVHNGSAFEKN
jgi:hypothetical protein